MSTTFRAAHTASAAQTASHSDQNLPSIFDVLSQDSLNSSLKPALRSLVKFFAQHYPHRLKLLHKYYDEFYVLFLLLLENHYLKHYSASFAENFYGMKRALLSSPTKSFPFSDFRSRLKSLICLVILPYLTDKIDKFVQRMNAVYPHQRSKLVNYILRIYPYVISAVRALFLVFQVLYVFRDYTPGVSLITPSPLLWMVRVFLQKLSAEDLQSFDSLPLHHQSSGILGRLWRLTLSATSMIGRLFSYAIFFLQFMEYFYANDLAKQFSAMGEAGDFSMPMTPVHPRKVIPSENYVLTSMEPGKCPLCFNNRVNDTTLAVSGYVFCYGCIFDYVSHEKRCPITKLPASTDQLVRLYTS